MVLPREKRDYKVFLTSVQYGFDKLMKPFRVSEKTG